jgi:elongator complex protein 3
MKPVRTVSGVAPVTVLTKPFPCPGNCIFCPVDVRMPKSYLASEPGAQRAENNFFDPYLQTFNRIQALYDMGHPVDKVELIVLGGTWSTYREHYQVWFVKECFRAMNEFKQKDKDDRDKIINRYQQFQQELSEKNYPVLSADRDKNEQVFSKYQIKGDTAEKNYNQLIQRLFLKPEKEVGLDQYQSASWDELEQEHQTNVNNAVRCVGLVLETRPDEIDEQEVVKLRRLGCTKVQIGLQSLQDEVLEKNKRGHDVAQSAQALELLRLAGFKIHAHWMPNLYGSDVEADKQDYLKLFEDDRFKPDELKIYPCSLLESAELMNYYQQDLWQPYTHDQLLEVLSFCLAHTPPYCRLTRVVRDIPSFDIVAGNKKTNFRQIAQQELDKSGRKSDNIRAREIRHHQFNPDEVYFDVVEYQTSVSREMFLQYVVDVEVDGQMEQKLLGFLRLSLPNQDQHQQFIDSSGLSTLKNAAMIREIHVYGQLVGIGQQAEDEAQHLGLGTKLIEKAKQITLQDGFDHLAVISAVGTRGYYQKRGFEDQGLYQVASFK